MPHLASFLFAAAFAITALSAADGACNLCSGLTNLACVSQTQFQVCINGTPVGAITSCPSGYVCSTVNATICQLNQTDAVIDCDDCNVCDENRVFACTGVQSYALCLNSTTPSDLTGSCAPNHICNIEYPEICVNTFEGIAPTCSTADQGTTTTTLATTISPLENPRKYCQQLQQRGRFPVGRNINTTCRRYIYCYLAYGVWSGAIYQCPGRTYFNLSGYCQDLVPSDCF